MHATDAMLSKEAQNAQLLYTSMPCAHAETYAQCAHHSRSSAMLSDCSQLIADGGCSIPACPAVLTVALRSVRDLQCISVLASTRACSCGARPGTPSMWSGARSALGPGRLSFNWENSLPGGALQATPTTPEKHSFWSRCMTLLSRISCVLCNAKSKGAK